jgi:hypothetical protein
LGCALVASAAACTSPASEPLGFGAVYEAPAAADGGAPAAFHAVRGSGPGDGWAVGEGGMAVAFAGGTWTPVDSGTTATLGGLDTLDVYHAFAVERGGARVLAWNGRAWSPLGADRADRAAAAAFAAGANDVWVVGDGIEHWDGTTWTQQVPGGAGAASTFTAISGSFRTDLWAVGPAGAWHFNGSAWAAVSLPAGAPPLAAVWTATLADTWIAGAQGTVLVWNGSSLTLVQTGTTKDLTAISGTGPTDVWAGGVDGAVVHWDGTSWAVSVTPAASTINDLWSDFPGDLFFVDGTGAVTHDAL